MHLIMKGKKIDHAPKLQRLFDSTCNRTAYSAGKKNPKALCVDLVFTVESPKSVSCDAIEIVDIVLLKFASDEAAG